jgi:hypothetical protein
MASCRSRLGTAQTPLSPSQREDVNFGFRWSTNLHERIHGSLYYVRKNIFFDEREQVRDWESTVQYNNVRGWKRL